MTLSTTKFEADDTEDRIRLDGQADAHRIIAGGRPQTFRDAAREVFRDEALREFLKDKVANLHPNLTLHDLGRGHFECLQALAQNLDNDENRAVIDELCPDTHREKLTDSKGRF